MSDMLDRRLTDRLMWKALLFAAVGMSSFGLVGGIALTIKTGKDARVRSVTNCRAGNELRDAVNKRSTTFLEATAASRDLYLTIAPLAVDDRVAGEIRRASRQLDRLLRTYNPLERIDCEDLP